MPSRDRGGCQVCLQQLPQADVRRREPRIDFDHDIAAGVVGLAQDPLTTPVIISSFWSSALMQRPALTKRIASGRAAVCASSRLDRPNRAGSRPPLPAGTKNLRISVTAGWYGVLEGKGFHKRHTYTKGFVMQRTYLKCLAGLIVLAASHMAVAVHADERIVSAATGLSLVPLRQTAGQNFGKLVMFDVQGQGVPDQRWNLVPTPNGVLIKNADTGLCVVPVRETAHQNFGQVVMFNVQGNGVLDQRWHIVQTSYGILIKSAATKLCLVPVRDEAHQNYGRVVLYKVQGEGVIDQRWLLE